MDGSKKPAHPRDSVLAPTNFYLLGALGKNSLIRISMGNVVLFDLFDPLVPRTPVQIFCCNALGIGVGGVFGGVGLI